jgi:hypothetical protein
MSSPLPPEILDLIAGHLRDEPMALKACCVVSKSWIYRTRKHLFASVEFDATKCHVELWKKAFPDPSNSPARYTHNLYICGIPPISAADTGTGGWINTFHNLACLHLECLDPVKGRQVSLVPFHGLSPTLRSLNLTTIYSEVLDLICSFPLLEDLALDYLGLGGGAWNTPPTSPKFTGSLTLKAYGTIFPLACRLLTLPGGLHFAKITVDCYHEDGESTRDLISACSDTLESLNVYCYIPGAPPSASTSSQYLTATREYSQI